MELTKDESDLLNHIGSGLQDDSMIETGTFNSLFLKGLVGINLESEPRYFVTPYAFEELAKASPERHQFL